MQKVYTRSECIDETIKDMNVHCMTHYFYSNFLTKVHNKSHPKSGGGAGVEAGGRAMIIDVVVFLKSP